MSTTTLPPVPDEHLAAEPYDGPPPGDGDGRPRRSYDRVPPHSLEAEVSVLGAALLSRDAASEVLRSLRPEDFYRSAHRVVFEALRDLDQNVGEIDEVVLVDHLRRAGRLDEVGGVPGILALTEAVPTAANAEYYAKIVKDHALLRGLVDCGTTIAKMGYEASGDARTVVDEAEVLVYRLAEDGLAGEYAEIGDLVGPAFENLEKLSENRSEVTGLATGFDDLDRLTAGLQPGNLIILAARPGMGKSSFALNLAHYVTVKLAEPAIFFSLEMSKLELTQRLFSFEAGIDQSRLRTGRLDEHHWQALGDALGELGPAPLFIDDTPMTTMVEIRAKARRLKKQRGLSLIVVDYLQLMNSHRQFDSRQVEVSQISRDMKALAMELQVPLIALSQLNRGPEARADARPMLSDLRESGSIEQDADIVAFIYRDEMYDADSQAKGQAELIVQKHRNGQTGTIHLAFISHLTKFANLARRADEF